MPISTTPPNEHPLEQSPPEGLTLAASLLRKMFSQHPSVRLLIDVNTGAIVDANDAAAAFYGYSREMLRTMTIYQINVGEQEEVAREMGRARVKEQNTFLFQHRLASGELRWVQVHSAPLEAKGWNLLFSVIHDVDDAVKNELELQESERKYRALFVRSPLPALVVKKDGGRILEANEAIARLLGMPMEALQNVDVATLQPASPEDAQTLTDIVAAHLSPPGPDAEDLSDAADELLDEETETELLAVDGRRIPVAVTASLVTHRGAPCVLFKMRDLTRAKSLEKLRADVENMTRHDLKSPLHAAVTVINLVLDEARLSAEHMEMLRASRQSLSDAADLLDKTRDILRMEVGAYVVEPAAVDPYEVVREVARDLEPHRRNRDITLTLPPPPGPTIFGERVLVRSILQNTLQNAVAACPVGGRVHLSAQPADDGGTIVLRVVNDGQVPESILPKFFEKYSTYGKRDGLGLGSYIIKLFAEQMGGDATVTSDSERNETTVSITLPALPSPPDREPGSAPRGPSAQSA